MNTTGHDDGRLSKISAPFQPKTDWDDQLIGRLSKTIKAVLTLRHKTDIIQSKKYFENYPQF